MSDRYYIPAPPDGTTIELPEDEAHHLAGVMRAKVGDPVELFDGQGGSYQGRVARVAKRAVQVEVIESHFQPADTRAARFTLAVALPKGDRQRWLIEKLVELGVTRIVALAASRSVAEPTDSALTRLRRAAIEAAKQSGGLWLPEVERAENFQHWIAAESRQAKCLVAHPTGSWRAAQLFEHLRNVAQESPATHGSHDAPHARVTIAIGPEGGWTDQEIAAAVSAGAETLDLGKNILRVETAAELVAAIFLLAQSTQASDPPIRLS